MTNYIEMKENLLKGLYELTNQIKEVAYILNENAKEEAMEYATGSSNNEANKSRLTNNLCKLNGLYIKAMSLFNKILSSKDVESGIYESQKSLDDLKAKFHRL